MRTLIDIPEQDLKALDQLSRDRGVSRDKIVRAAIGEYRARQSADAAFGVWSEASEDAVDYQRRLRRGW